VASAPAAADLGLSLTPPAGFQELTGAERGAGTALAYRGSGGVTFNLIVRGAGEGGTDGRGPSDAQLDVIGALLRRAQAKSGAHYRPLGAGRRQVAGASAPFALGAFHTGGRARKVCQVAVPDPARARMLLFTLTGDAAAFDRALPGFWAMLGGLRLRQP
jgi:hypothetical protein